MEVAQSAAQVDLAKITSLCKRRGFVFQSSEIYGGLASTWDYGPLGVEMKRNIRDAWWRTMVLDRDDMVGLDAAILMHPDVWRASGHLESFSDPLVECTNCKHRFRLDQLVYGRGKTESGVLVTVSRTESTPEEVVQALEEKAASVGSPLASHLLLSLDPQAGAYAGPITSLPCPVCDIRALTEPRKFNLMFKTSMGPVEDDASVVYLRPETAQGIFVNFGNVLTATRRKPPFGIAQIGKAFRNEITTGQLHLPDPRVRDDGDRVFCPARSDDEEWFDRWIDESMRWYTDLGVSPDRLRVRASRSRGVVALLEGDQ